MDERKSQKDEAIGQAAELVRIFRPRWDVFVVKAAIEELVNDGREFAATVAAAVRAARDPEVRTPYASVFESYWDEREDAEVNSYADAVAGAKQTIRDRTRRVRACDRCDDRGYIDGRLCPHADPGVIAEQAHERAERAREQIRPLRLQEVAAQARKEELVGEWQVSADQQAEALRKLEAHMAEHPELAPPAEEATA